MVSKASEDLPEPESPVDTTSSSRGIATSTFLRLCSRAPRIEITRESRRLLGPVAFLLGSKRSFMRSHRADEHSENDAALPVRLMHSWGNRGAVLRMVWNLGD